jgi:uncharacterized protein (DUF305 family)
LKNFGRYGLLTLLLVAALALAACGGGEGAQEDGNGQDEDAQEMEENGNGMDNGDMDHGDMDNGDMAGMLMEDGEYSDELFIDHMVPHHQGAMDMAEVALENSEREEVLQLSEDIIAEQEAEIEELQDIKEAEFGTREVPMEMSEEEMDMMGMSMDPEELADEEPFDLAFIDHMIPHHQSAVEMSEVALEESESPEILQLSEDIIESQESEIALMEDWREEWYPEES